MKKIVKFILILIPILIIASLGVLAWWYFLPINKIKRAINVKDYSMVVSVYDELKKDDEILYVQNELLCVATGYYDDYLAEDIEYKDINRYFTLVGQNVLKKDKAFLTYKDNLSEIYESRNSYSRGIEYMEDNSYIDAIEEFVNVSKKDKKYKNKANDLIEECKILYIDEIIEQADIYISKQDYEQAKTIVLEGIEHFPDDNTLLLKLEEIKDYEKFEEENQAINLDGMCFVATYDVGNIIANELGISGYDISFPIDLIMDISEGNASFYVDSNSIKPALDVLVANNMDAIYSVASSYGIGKSEADLFVKFTYGGSYSAFIMDNFSSEINDALNDYTYSFDYSVTGDKMYIDGKDDEYLTVDWKEDSITMLEYTGESSMLNMLEYPMEFERK